MTDLTKIEKPFGLLSKDVQEELREYERQGGVVEYFDLYGNWSSKGAGHWWLELTYRAKPLTKPSINWDHVHEDFIAMATDDSTGSTWFHKRKPIWREGAFWTAGEGRVVIATAFASFTPGTCAPKDSLVMRPGYEEGEQ